jgi:hypothetical protein
MAELEMGFHELTLSLSYYSIRYFYRVNSYVGVKKRTKQRRKTSVEENLLRIYKHHFTSEIAHRIFTFSIEIQ